MEEEELRSTPHDTDFEEKCGQPHKLTQSNLSGLIRYHDLTQ